MLKYEKTCTVDRYGERHRTDPCYVRTYSVSSVSILRMAMFISYAIIFLFGRHHISGKTGRKVFFIFQKKGKSAADPLHDLRICDMVLSDWSVNMGLFQKGNSHRLGMAYA